MRSENLKISQTKNHHVVAQLNKYIHDLHASLYPDFFKEYSFNDSQIFFKEIMERPEFIFLLLEEDETPLGYAMIELRNYPERIFIKPYQSVFVHHISISGDQKRKGYGSKLMEEVYNIAQSNGIHKIELDYWFDNEIAKNFYEKNNFVKQRVSVFKEI